LGREFGCGDLMVAAGVGDDRGGHLQDVLADRGGRPATVGMPRSSTSAASASECIGWPARRPGNSQRELRFGPVRAENLVHGPDQQGCHPSRLTVMITRHVPAVCLLLITRTTSWLQLSRSEETWRIAEILILRHQLAVLQRRQPRRPRLNWADRAPLATLLGAIPKARRQGLRLLVTPDTMLRWHRDIAWPRVMSGQLGQGEPTMRSTVVVRWKPGMKCSSTSEFTVPFVVSGRSLSPST
jgi:hypothetical protein